MPEFYDRDGNRIEAHQWVELTMEDRRVAEDFTPAGERVSTVLLGLNHNWGMGPPLIFETMVFGGDRDGEQERYSTLEQAQLGHKAMLAMLLARGIDDE